MSVGYRRNGPAGSSTPVGSINLTAAPYNVIPNSPAAAAANLTGVQAAIADGQAQKKAVYWPGGDLYISGGTITFANSENAYFSSTRFSRIIQMTDNIPIVQIGTPLGYIEHLSFGGFKLAYNTQQPNTNTAAAGIRFEGDNIWMSRFFDIEVQNAAFGIKQSSSNFLFSCSFNDITVRSCTNTAISLTSRAASTGNVWNRVHLTNGSPGSRGNCFGLLRMDNWQGTVFNQLNLEHSRAGTFMDINTARPVVFNSLHMEGLEARNGYARLGQFQFASNVVINGFDAQDCVFDTANGVNNPAIFGVGDSTQLEVTGALLQKMVKTGLTDLAWANSTAGATGSQNSQITIEGVQLATGNGITKNDAVVVHASSANQDPVLKRFNGVTVVGSGLGAIRTPTANYTALPIDGTILANAAGAALTVTLPRAIAGRRLEVKKTDSSVNTVTVAPPAVVSPTPAITIDGAASKVIASLNDAFTFVSDGTNWFIV